MTSLCTPVDTQDSFNSWLYPIRNQLNLSPTSRVQLLAQCGTFWCTEPTHWVVNGEPLMKYSNMSSVLANDGFTLVAHTIGQAVRAFLTNTSACIICDFTEKKLDNPDHIIFSGKAYDQVFVPFGNTPAPAAILFLSPGYSAHHNGGYWAKKICGSPYCINPRHYNISTQGTMINRYAMTPLLENLHKLINSPNLQFCFPNFHHHTGGWICGYPYLDLEMGILNNLSGGRVLPDNALVTPGQSLCTTPTCANPNHYLVNVNYKHCFGCNTPLTLQNATPGWTKCSSCNPF